MSSDRFDRQIRLFGREGQAKIGALRVVVVGVGGLGSHVVQQLALLGVRHLVLVDSDELDETGRNRLVGARHNDPIPGTPKIAIARRVIEEIDPTATAELIPEPLASDAAFRTVKAADFVFGCVDSEGTRLILNELCAAYERSYIDLASDVIPGDPPEYGGRICVAGDGHGCIVCLGQLDAEEAQIELAGEGARRNREAIYGVGKTTLGRSGPSVVSVNGVVASLGVTEFMVAVTGIRVPKKLITYRGHRGIVTVRAEPTNDCYYCSLVRGKREAANVERYLRGVAHGTHS